MTLPANGDSQCFWGGLAARIEGAKRSRSSRKLRSVKMVQKRSEKATRSISPDEDLTKT